MKLILTVDQNRSLDVPATLHTLSAQERFAFASKKFFLFFGLAVVSVFLPVLHFVLVPTFLLISVIVLIKSFKIKQRLTFENPPACLSCQKPLSPNYFLGAEPRVQCPHCFAWYILSEK